MHERHTVITQGVEQALSRGSRERFDRVPGDTVFVIVPKGDRCAIPGHQYIAGDRSALLEGEQGRVLLGLLSRFRESGSFASIEASRRLVLDHDRAVDDVNEPTRLTWALDVSVELIRSPWDVEPRASPFEIVLNLVTKVLLVR
jgi:hypothetical protein